MSIVLASMTACSSMLTDRIVIEYLLCTVFDKSLDSRLVTALATALSWDASDDKSFSVPVFVATLMLSNIRPSNLRLPDGNHVPDYMYRSTLSWGDFILFLSCTQQSWLSFDDLMSTGFG